jgi:hypothetical protein
MFDALNWAIAFAFFDLSSSPVVDQRIAIARVRIKMGGERPQASHWVFGRERDGGGPPGKRTAVGIAAPVCQLWHSGC